MIHVSLCPNSSMTRFRHRQFLQLVYLYFDASLIFTTVNQPQILQSVHKLDVMWINVFILSTISPSAESFQRFSNCFIHIQSIGNVSRYVVHFSEVLNGFRREWNIVHRRFYLLPAQRESTINTPK